jgi:hypothetical protein
MSKIMRVRPLNATHNLGLCETGVRDTIIRIVERDYADEAFASAFVNHLKKIGSDKFDQYSEIEFKLPEFSTRLVFQTRRSDPDEMTYTLPDCTLDPDPRLTAAAPRARSWFGGLFG